MRISICAQSCDSVPPAPGWMERMAFFSSWGPDRMTLISKASSSSRSRTRLAAISGPWLSSPASVAISQRSRASSAWVVSSRKRVTVRFCSARSWTRVCARRVSSQKLVLAISASMAASRDSRAGRSKMTSEVLEAPLHFRHVTLQLAQHRDLRKKV